MKKIELDWLVQDIPIIKNDTMIGYLKPITIELANDDCIVELLTKWRQKYMHFFLTQFQATIDRTKLWLDNIVMHDDARLLFLIYDNADKIVGNYGIANIDEFSIELDNLIRGEEGGDKRLIFYSELSLINWILNKLKIENIYCHVFTNNNKTLSLHHSTGFTDDVTYTLLKKEQNGEIDYIISGPQSQKEKEEGIGYVKMNLDKNKFLSVYEDNIKAR